MTATILATIIAYSALLGLIAKRELPETFRLPYWAMYASAAAGMAAAAAALPRLPQLDNGSLVLYPAIVASGALALLAVAGVTGYLRSVRGAATVAT